jgi:hypothetical protein
MFEDPPKESSTGRDLISDLGTLRWFLLEVADSPGGHPDYSDQQTFIHVANTNPFTVTVRSIFRGPGGVGQRDFNVGPGSRLSVPFVASQVPRVDLPGQVLPPGFYTAELHSRSPGGEIQVSSTVFNGATPPFGQRFWDASKAVNGATLPRRDWYFGEGGAFAPFPPIGGPVFDHWYIVYNPNPFSIVASAELYPDKIDNGGRPQSQFTRSYSVPPNGRLAFNPHADFVGLNIGSRAARINCTQDCFAQVIMNQLRNVGVRRPNSQSTLGSAPAKNWYVVGIPTQQVWQHRIYILNPTNQDIRIEATYYNSAGTPISRSRETIPALNRIGYDLNETTFDAGFPRELAQAPQGLGGGNLSLQITANPDNIPGRTEAIVLTKIQYWSRNGAWSEGASTTGHSRGGSRVIIPGGNTGNGTDTFTNLTQVMHVGDVGSAATNVWATVLTPGGNCGRRHVGVLNPKGVLQVAGGACPGHVGELATMFESDGPPIIAESTNLLSPDLSGNGTPWRSGDAAEGIVYVGGTPIQP